MISGESRAAAALLAAGAGLLAAGCGDSAGRPSLPELTREGVSRTLAEWRAGRVDSLRYRLRFRLPADTASPVEGRARITFRRRDGEGPVILDFAARDSAVRSVESRGSPVSWELRGGHLVVPAAEVTGPDGRAALEVEFVAGDGPLNRNPEYLYTLFVPARAREAFPCFDQPDLKGRFRLTVDAPAEWRVVSNTPRLPSPEPPEGEELAGPGRSLHRFAETAPLPTYLFSFAAGRFSVETAVRAGRTLRMFHRETDRAKVERNRTRAFDLHAAALRWLEEYTGIEYAFEKFDFVLVPSFQYNGMEHPGAVLYRSSSVLLDESATEGRKLGRASLIAHETAHMWFGDLVTTEWFNDVWMKEVFANFMAAKIVHPSFPDIDHDLRFLLDHYPAAYAVDRSEGTHPIRQELPNLADAGSLYGAIIYQKAPVVMRQLEALVSPEAFRGGVRAYLEGDRWGNAGWPELVAAVDARADLDVAAWSRVWVEEAGRPVIRTRLEAGEAVDSLLVLQSDPLGRGRRWPQRLRVGLGPGDSMALLPVELRARTAAVRDARGRPAPGFVLPGGAGEGYGRFVLDPASRRRLMDAFAGLRPAVSRAAAWLTLWDGMLEGEIPPEEIVRLARDAVGAEERELLAERMLADLAEAWWRYLDGGSRRRMAPAVEAALLEEVRSASSTSLQAAAFEAYRTVAVSEGAVARLRAVWEERSPPAGLPLSERDYTELAQALAGRGVEGSREILETQAERIENPDRRERFRWVAPALSPDPAVRDSFFRALARPGSRRHEPWVLEGLAWLHHPLRAGESRRYVEPALEMLREVRATGDIFFPRGWLDATFRGHASAEVARTVRAFLEERPDYPGFLEDKILQAADPVFRAARIRADAEAGGAAGR